MKCLHCDRFLPLSEESIVEIEAKNTADEHILVLPGQLFFVERVELPDGLEDQEVDDFAELSLEGLAPFPIEQLYWGFLTSPNEPSLLVYAAHKGRLKQEGFEELENYTWVLPDFAIVAEAHFPEATNVLLNGENGTTRIELSKGEGLPKAIDSRPTKEELPPANQSAAELEISATAYELSEQSLPTFTFEEAEKTSDEITGHWRKLTPGEASLWRADVRNSAYKIAEKNKRRLTKWATRATGYGAIFALVLILLEGFLLAGNFWMGMRTSKIAAQEPEVLRIEDKQSLMNKLDQVAQNELRPITILDALNNARPKGIYFTSTTTEGQNRITIDGIADTINELNSYTETLRKSGTFELIGDPKSITRSGKTTFTVTLDYNHTAFLSNQGQEG
ncbi:MAG: PilN domain-containing protein [Verrucomicrobiota bacterium]